MKDNKIKKSLLIAVTFIITVFVAGVCFAEQKTTIKQLKSVADFTSIDPKIEHTKIDTVLANGILNAKVYSLFGDASSAYVVLEYKVDSGNVRTVEKEITNKRDFFVGTPKGEITKENDHVYYRIKAVFNVEDEDFILYTPSGTSATEFATVDVVKKIEKEVDGASGGAISVFCGDQYKGDNGYVTVNVPGGAYSGQHKVIVDFLDELSNAGAVDNSQTKENIISAVSVDVEGISDIAAPIQINNLPLQIETRASKFFMQYKEGADWKNITTANLSVDKQEQIFSFLADSLGRYRVLESIVLSKSSYRPENRIVVKAKVGNSYPGFEFKYLKEGDTVTIYNLKGRKVRKITADGSSDITVWNGRRDNGDWAESGTYLYQIKLKDGGDIISGTIAFVW